MTNKRAIILLLACIATGSSLALNDPYLRDDDIGGTEVAVDVSHNEFGLYVYRYNIQAPPENTGYILTYVLDIACPEVPDPRGFHAGDFDSNTSPSSSLDNRHVPVAIDAPWGQAAVWGISEGNEIHWLIGLNPGEEALNLQVVTPYPPGTREYRLVPSADYRWEEWNYASVEEEDPDLPWIDDWTVTGMTTGPACPGEEYPDEGSDNTRFPAANDIGVR